MAKKPPTETGIRVKITRHPNSKSLIKSADVTTAVDECYLCGAGPGRLRVIEYTRNGFQNHTLIVCADCRKTLRDHLS